jgi:uncharacterized membrane-anchored protein YjiN (DUF445 family)
MNKSMLTNLIALVLLVLGVYLNIEWLYSVAIFALSGALTNWLAVHMLFEKIPGVYGSGVVQIKFESFKQGIHNLVMEQFFNQENIAHFLSNADGSAHHFDLEPVIENVDFTPAFDSLLKTVMDSQLGGMLGMLGGAKALDPLRDPFSKNIKASIIEIARSDSFAENLRQAMGGKADFGDLQSQVGSIVEQRLNELTPQMVKQIIQDMIRNHLGWLVVWGGVFGGLIGLVAGFL